MSDKTIDAVLELIVIIAIFLILLACGCIFIYLIIVLNLEFIVNNISLAINEIKYNANFDDVVFDNLFRYKVVKYVLIDHDSPFYEPGLHIYKAQLMLNIASWLVISSIGIIVIGIFVSFFTIIASTIKGTNIEKPNVTRIVANPSYIIPLIFCISIISLGKILYYSFENNIYNPSEEINVYIEKIERIISINKENPEFCDFIKKYIDDNKDKLSDNISTRTSNYLKNDRFDITRFTDFMIINKDFALQSSQNINTGDRIKAQTAIMEINDQRKQIHSLIEKISILKYTMSYISLPVCIIGLYFLSIKLKINLYPQN
jgi:hypothetical protein